MNRVQLLSPAGNLEKAKIALIYGSDAVYVGGKEFSLRARASNFERSDLKELCEFAHNLGKKVYVTCNIIPHDEDLKGLTSYLKFLGEINVDAIITSSVFIMLQAKTICPNTEVHVSTQTSITNSSAIAFYQTLGVTRVVLSREVSLEEMAKIRKQTNLELEVFIHGGMCASYSGRCTLSNYMTSRDANRGGCAHSCRWNYNLTYKKKRINKKNEYFNMGSKDLMAVRQIPKLLDLGIESLKIEGRMKSAYYIATVVRSYKMVIDEYYKTKGNVSEEVINEAILEIQKAENRLTSHGFLCGIPTFNEQLYDIRCEEPTKEYVGFVLDYDEATSTCLLEQRNYFEVGDTLEFFGPNLKNTLFKVEKMTDENHEELEVARHPLQKILITVPFKLTKCDMARLVKTRK